jgi:hypothetical protein
MTGSSVTAARRAAALVAAIAVVTIPLASLPTVRASVAHDAAPSCGWAISAWPRAGNLSVLSGVTASSATEAWAVGWRKQQLVEVPLTYHWDGSSWTATPAETRDGSERDIFLNAVSVGPNDTWAVGTSVDGLARGTTLVERWEGSSWSIVDSPNPGVQSNLLTDVSAIPRSKGLWAVGAADQRTLIERWTGSRWRSVPSPSPRTGDGLLYVSASGPNDAWASGLTNGGVSFALHWDGTAWSIAPDPGPESRIVALADGTALASGLHFERWDGSSWSQLGTLYGAADDIAATADDGWAVGYRTGSGAKRTWTAHWDGRVWKEVASPNVKGEHADLLYGVAQVPASTESWAVGITYRQLGSHGHRYRRQRPLILHHC